RIIEDARQILHGPTSPEHLIKDASRTFLVGADEGVFVPRLVERSAAELVVIHESRNENRMAEKVFQEFALGFRQLVASQIDIRIPFLDDLWERGRHRIFERKWFARKMVRVFWVLLGARIAIARLDDFYAKVIIHPIAQLAEAARTNEQRKAFERRQLAATC